MKRLPITSSLLAICLAGSGCFSASTTQARHQNGPLVASDPRTINVTGEAEVLVEPDFVEITVGTEGRDLDAQKARSQCNDAMTSVIEAARAAGVAEKDLATDNFRLDPIYRWEEDREVFVGYLCAKTLVVTLREPERLDKLVETLVTAGADRMQGVEFRTSALRKHRDEARRLALIAAREKATAMAGVLGEDVGAPQSINETYSFWSPWEYGGRTSRMMAQNVSQDMGGSGSPSEAPSSTALGRIRVRANVSVVFRLD